MQNKELLAHIDGCRQGDSKSQRWIFERYYRVMFGVCMRYVSDKDAVQDVVQEGFLKVFTNIEGYTSKGSFEGWMRRIMVNTSIDAIRRRKATGLVLGDEKSFEDVVDEGEEYEVDDDEYTFTVKDVQEAMSQHLAEHYRQLQMQQQGLPTYTQAYGEDPMAQMQQQQQPQEMEMGGMPPDMGGMPPEMMMEPVEGGLVGGGTPELNAAIGPEGPGVNTLEEATGVY